MNIISSSTDIIVNAVSDENLVQDLDEFVIVTEQNATVIVKNGTDELIIKEDNQEK